MVSKEDIIDELYKLAGHHKASEIRKFIPLLDKYVVTVIHKRQASSGWGADTSVSVDRWAHLKPGQTDVDAGMRRCLGCGQVKHFTRSFIKDSRSPHGRALRCTACRPPKGHRPPDLYLCRCCNVRKPLTEFPQAKQDNTVLRLNCTDCNEARQK